MLEYKIIKWVNDSKIVTIIMQIKRKINMVKVFCCKLIIYIKMQINGRVTYKIEAIIRTYLSN